jgi:hypothetical protein
MSLKEVASLVEPAEQARLLETPVIVSETEVSEMKLDIEPMAIAVLLLAIVLLVAFCTAQS